MYRCRLLYVEWKALEKNKQVNSRSRDCKVLASKKSKSADNLRCCEVSANAVEVVIGIKKDVHEPGTTTAAMTKDGNGLWTVTLGPLEPNLYEYQFSLDGLKIADPGTTCPNQRGIPTRACF
jgi:hypothetical protein